MNKDEIRLECLKITYTHGRDATEAVARAQELEAYVASGVRKKKPLASSGLQGRKPGRPKKADKTAQ